MVEHFYKGHLETPLPKMNLSLIPGIGGHSEQKVHTELAAAVRLHLFLSISRLIRRYLQSDCLISSINFLGLVTRTGPLF